MANQIVAEIVLDLDTLKGQLKEAQDAGKQAGKKVGDNLGGDLEAAMSKSFGKIAALAAAVGSTLLAAFSFKKAIESASKQEDAINSLNSALQITGKFTESASQRFQDFASSLQKTSTVADEVIIQGGAMLVTLGKLSGEGLERATQASLDLAAGLNIDVNQAFELVAKAATGHTSALQRYGLEVKTTGDKNRDFANTLEKINSQFGGLAESKINTFSGAITKLGNTFDDLLEEIGNIIIKSPVLIEIIKFISDKFEILGKTISELSDGEDLLGDFLKNLIDVAITLTQVVMPTFELFFNLVNTGFKAIQTSVLSFLGLFSEDFKTKADSAFAGLKEASENIFTFNATQTTEDFLNGIKQVADKASEAANDAGKKIKAGVESGIKGITFEDFAIAFNTTANKIQVSASNLAKSFQQSFIGGMTNSLASFGGALARGENAFAAFGKGVLGSLGDILINFGQMLIAVGIGLSSVPFLFGLSGGAAIAAGAAAVILGGALKALAGGGGGVGSTTGAGGPGTIGGAGPAGGINTTAGSDVGQFNETVRENPSTSLTVNVQGNILDRRQTGLEIAEVIQETFSSNGIQFSTGTA